MADLLRKDIFSLGDQFLDPGLYKLVRTDTTDKTKLVPDIMIVGETALDRIVVLGEKDHLGTQILLPKHASYIQTGDIALVSGNSLRVVLSRAANANTLLVTERCNNLCLFCSQPPKEVDDEILLGMAANALISFDFDGEVGITGGEPMLYKEKFLSFLDVLDDYNVPSSLHILTNGRAFKDKDFVAGLSKYRNRPITFGIPLYSTESTLHDTLVSSQGAWIDTILGLINIQYAGFPVELRFIPTAINLDELDRIIPFSARSLPMLSQISIMNLEPKGWARKNWDTLYVSPSTYLQKLRLVGKQTELYSMNVRLFNYPLCHIPETVYKIAEKSISDWKNNYKDECANCSVVDSCGGFFSSSEGKFLDKPRALQ